MAIVVALVGIGILTIGVMFAVAPNELVTWGASVDPGRRFWMAVLAPAAVGISFLLVAPGGRVPWLIQVFGMLGLLRGAVTLLLGRRNLSHLMALLSHAPPWLLRMLSIPAIGGGALLLYLGF